MARYETYKDTNLQWIGEIPDHWTLSRIGAYFDERSEKVDDVNFPALSVTMSGIVDQLSDVAKTDDGENRKLVRKDDFVINSRSDRKGSSGISPRDGSVSLINIVLKPKDIDPAYIQHLFKSYYFKEEFFRNGKGIHWDLWTTRWYQLKNINIPIPHPHEQRLISRYLDQKTQQIDTLIENIEKKIELLKEHRTSLINHYVTKGLYPNVEMKESGVEWIGKIPKHWELKKLKHIVGDSGLIRGPFGGALKIETFKPSGFKVYEQKNAIYSDLSLGGSYVDEKKFRELSRFQVHSGDILMSCSGTIGKTTLIPQQFEEGIINQALLIIRIENPDLTEPQYIQKLFSSWFFEEQVIENSQGGAMKNLVGIDVFKNVTLPLPPSEEQKTVLMTITTESLLIDQLISKERRRRDLLTEYRQSLISSVVTGKVRVTKDMV